MDDLAYIEVIPTLFRSVPEAKDSYDAWEMPGEPLPYLVFSFLEESLFTPAVISGHNHELLRRMFDFFERMALSRSDDVINLLWVGLFEPWVLNPTTMSNARKHMRQATKALASQAAQKLTGAELG